MIRWYRYNVTFEVDKDSWYCDLAIEVDTNIEYYLFAIIGKQGRQYIKIMYLIYQFIGSMNL